MKRRDFVKMAACAAGYVVVGNPTAMLLNRARPGWQKPYPMEHVLAPPDASTELIDLRSRGGKVFALGNPKKNKRHSRTLLGPVHYEQDRGSGLWLDVDNRAHFSGGSWKIDKAWYDLNTLPGKVGYFYRSKAGGSAELSLTHLDGVPVEDLSLRLVPRLDGDKLWFDEIVPGL
ncbi:MAG: twin-arginine translocation signal domain-containing protein, partial [bacterium]|nr:twin-arginine translocation signal domain-containing protein [bacterium]